MTYTCQNSAVLMNTGFYPGISVSATALGEESDKVLKAYEAFIRDFFIPLSRELLFPQMKFYRLKSQMTEDWLLWGKEQGYIS